MAEDSLDDVVSDEESTICEEKPNLSNYTIPTSIDTEAIFASISDFSRASVGKINQSLTILRKRHSPSSSPTGILDCERVENCNEDQDKMKYFIFMLTIRLGF